MQNLRNTQTEYQLHRNTRFLVIEAATGKPVGDGKPMPYAFAKFVRDTRDTFGTGAFFMKQVLPTPKHPTDEFLKAAE